MYSLVSPVWSGHQPLHPTESPLNKVTESFLTSTSKGHFSVVMLMLILKYPAHWPLFPTPNSPSLDPRTKTSPDLSSLTWKLLVSGRLFSFYLPFPHCASPRSQLRASVFDSRCPFWVSPVTLYLHFNDCILSLLESATKHPVILNSLLSPFSVLTVVSTVIYCSICLSFLFLSSHCYSSFQGLIIPHLNCWH